MDLHDGLIPQWEHQGEYATHVFTRKAVEIIDKHDQNAPLFLILSHLAAHTGDQGIELGVPNITQTHETYHYIQEPERRQIAGNVSISSLRNIYIVYGHKDKYHQLSSTFSNDFN